MINEEEEDRSNLIKFNISGSLEKQEKNELDSGESFDEKCDEQYPIKIIEEDKELKIKKDKNSLNTLFKNKVVTKVK